MAKSCIHGIGIQKSFIEEVANHIGCRVGVLPFTYLGLPIGHNMNKAKEWKFVVDKFESRLADWKAKTISFGGRLTQIKSVLSSLSLYAFSLFRAPTNVINLLEEENEDVLIMDRIVQDGNSWNFSWQWLREPIGRTKDEFEDLKKLVNNFNFSWNSSDTWKCTLHANGVFSTNMLTKLLDQKLLPSPLTANETMINNLLPKKN
ncbi:uncharacterized protein [Rutidosis leptorrhynchoides]|uniref:uncharacterized protein n=1 Tax=Rutidosis leptorrhynchoides TaxID=125765 RepID=UPI003A99173E